MSESLRPTAPLGILMLDTRFPRIVGDIGNAASFDFPVIFRRMDGIGSADAVTAHPDRPRVLAALRANAEALAAEGAVGLSTSCGFLALYQDDLSAVSPVPVATSALLLIKQLKGKRIGVITASARNLGQAHFAAVGAPVDTPFVGLPEDSSFAATFLKNGLTLDRDRVEAEAVGLDRPPSRHRHGGPRMHQPAAVQAGTRTRARPAGIRCARPVARIPRPTYRSRRR